MTKSSAQSAAVGARPPSGCTINSRTSSCASARYECNNGFLSTRREGGISCPANRGDGIESAPILS